jgi:hypothetical protein
VCAGWEQRRRLSTMAPARRTPQPPLPPRPRSPAPAFCTRFAGRRVHSLASSRDVASQLTGYQAAGATRMHRVLNSNRATVSARRHPGSQILRAPTHLRQALLHVKPVLQHGRQPRLDAIGQRRRLIGSGPAHVVVWMRGRRGGNILSRGASREGATTGASSDSALDLRRPALPLAPQAVPSVQGSGSLATLRLWPAPT